MKKFFHIALTGLSPQYYFRQLFFGAMIALILYFFLVQENQTITVGMVLYGIANTLLYPYSRFVYEAVVSFILGDHVFAVNSILMFTIKLITIAFCWSLAMVVAPIGLIYLYFFHSRK